MPADKGKFNLGASLKKHSGDETEYGQDYSRLPGDFSGVCQLVTAQRGRYKSGVNAGKEFVRLAGVVVEPETATETIRVWDPAKKIVKVVSSKEVKVAGRQTSVMLPLCATKVQGKNPRTISEDENVAAMLNMLRRVGGEDFTSDIESEDDLNTKLKELEEAKPFVQFSTQATTPNALRPEQRVFENWLRAAEDGYEPPNARNGAVDEPEPEGEGEEAAEEEGEATEVEESAETSETDSDDLEALVAEAEGGDKAARARLKELAVEAGADEEAVDNADTWQDVADMIGAEEASDDEAEEEAEEEAAAEEEESEPFVPVKGKSCGYKPIDKKTKKRTKTAVECRITAVDKKAEKVDLLNLDDKKTIYKSVPFAELIES